MLATFGVHTRREERGLERESRTYAETVDPAREGRGPKAERECVQKKWVVDAKLGV